MPDHVQAGCSLSRLHRQTLEDDGASHGVDWKCWWISSEHLHEPRTSFSKTRVWRNTFNVTLFGRSPLAHFSCIDCSAHRVFTGLKSNGQPRVWYVWQGLSKMQKRRSSTFTRPSNTHFNPECKMVHCESQCASVHDGLVSLVGIVLVLIGVSISRGSFHVPTHVVLHRRKPSEVTTRQFFRSTICSGTALSLTARCLRGASCPYMKRGCCWFHHHVLAGCRTNRSCRIVLRNSSLPEFAG